MIISILDKSAGFFSLLFFSINHYIYARKQKKLFILDTENWMFKYKKGWEDYFEEPIQEDDVIPSQPKIAGFQKTLDDYPMKDYETYIKDYYQYNSHTKEQILNKKRELKLYPSNEIQYGSIFIRRGDRLFGESKFIHGELYIKKMLELRPDINIIFLQTEDYTCYEEIEHYIKTNHLHHIKLLTLSNPNQRGSLTSRLPNYINTNIEKNKEYINKVRRQLHNTTEVINMTPEQKYKHTMDMIIGLDIVLCSQICICDYQSNVSRFIKLAHPQPNNVYDVFDTPFDYNKKICPAYPTSVYEDPDKYIHT